MKFHPTTDNRDRLPVSYTTVKEHLITYIQREYDHGADIAQSLKDLAVYDVDSEKPTRQESNDKDINGDLTATGEFEQKTFDKVYDAEIKLHVERKSTLQQNLKKAYAYIWGTCCTRTMQNKVEEQDDFSSKIENNPIELLKIVETLMHDHSAC